VSGGPQDVLIIGYGNPLRSDDGVGWQAAELLTDDPRLADAQILACHQLTPELAEDVSRAGFVVLIDASTEPGVPGSVETRTTSTRAAFSASPRSFTGSVRQQSK
jgi:hydrogenase maturation protease